MKTRNGFVSNSSSSSFIVSKSALTNLQQIMIKNHMEVCKLLGVFFDKTCIPRKWVDGCDGDAWDIQETTSDITGDTSMDNFDMQEFMQQIGVPMALVTFESGHW